MTETEWLTSDDPVKMLGFATENPDHQGIRCCRSDRKLQNLCDAWRSDICGEWRYCMAYIGVSSDDKLAPAFSLAINIGKEFKPIAAHLLRDIVGNPHRILTLQDGRLYVGKRAKNEICLVSRVYWLTPAVLALARGIYEERRFEDMPILADALEEAGCDHEGILRHCRGWEQCPQCRGEGWLWNDMMVLSTEFCEDCGGTGWISLRGHHVRGCWVLDLLLGQE